MIIKPGLNLGCTRVENPGTGFLFSTRIYLGLTQWFKLIVGLA